MERYHRGAFKSIELQTVTYGTKSAPFLTMRCLSQLASDGAMKFALVFRALTYQCYVDDILSGANFWEEAVKLKEQLDIS